MNVIEKLTQLQKKILLKQRIKLIKFETKIDILLFSASIANKFKFLTITIKKICNDFEFYIIEVIKIFVVETSIIVDDVLTKKQTKIFKNIKFYHDKIVKKTFKLYTKCKHDV